MKIYGKKKKQSSPIFSALQLQFKSMNIPNQDFNNFDKYKMWPIGKIIHLSKL